MEARMLTGENELKLVQELLYQIYVQELGWNVAEDNPSGIRITGSSSDKLRFRDNFEAHSTVFGVFDGDEIVGTIRLLKPFEKRIELEHYRKIPKNLLQDSPIKYEVNRMAILKSRQHSTALVHLLHAVAEYLTRSDCEILFASLAEPEPANFCRKLGFVKSDPQGFKYNSSDQNLVWLHHLNCKDKQILEKILSICGRIIGL